MFETTMGIEKIAGASLVVAIIIYIIMVAITIYTLYLNWRQARVSDQMKELIEINKEIRDTLKKNSKK